MCNLMRVLNLTRFYLGFVISHQLDCNVSMLLIVCLKLAYSDSIGNQVCLSSNCITCLRFFSCLK